MDKPGSVRLTEKETFILRCLINGDEDKTIAKKGGISRNTVRVHIKTLFQKTGIHNRTQMAIWGWHRGFAAIPGSSPCQPSSSPLN